MWGEGWDALLRRQGRSVGEPDEHHAGRRFPTYRANDGAYVRDHFFGRDPRTKALVARISDKDIWSLKRGGHDYRKIYSAYRAAVEHKGQPTVIPAKTIKATPSVRTSRPERHSPDEEADAGGPQGLPRRDPDSDQRRTTRGEPLPAAVLPPGSRSPGNPLPARPAHRSGRLRPAAAQSPAR